MSGGVVFLPEDGNGGVVLVIAMPAIKTPTSFNNFDMQGPSEPAHELFCLAYFLFPPVSVFISHLCLAPRVNPKKKRKKCSLSRQHSAERVKKKEREKRAKGVSGGGVRGGREAVGLAVLIYA